MFNFNYIKTIVEDTGEAPLASLSICWWFGISNDGNRSKQKGETPPLLSPHLGSRKQSSQTDHTRGTGELPTLSRRLRNHCLAAPQ